MATICLALGLAAAGPLPASAGGSKVVVFDIEPVEMPKTPETQQRLAASTAHLRKLLADAGYTVVDTAPQAAKIAENQPLSECNGCDRDIAQALGADLEVATAVHASSAVNFNLSGNVKDVKTDKVLRQGVVNISGGSDDEWNHGVKFLVKERLLDPPLPATGRAASGAP